MNATLMLFLAFIVVTLGITYWASRRSGSALHLISRRTAKSRHGRTASP